MVSFQLGNCLSALNVDSNIYRVDLVWRNDFDDFFLLTTLVPCNILIIA